MTIQSKTTASLLIYGAAILIATQPSVARVSNSKDCHQPLQIAQQRYASNFVVASTRYSLKDTDGLANACHSEFGLHHKGDSQAAHVLDIDADFTSLSWHYVAPLFDHRLQRFQHYWALASPEYLEKMNDSQGVVLEYLWDEDAIPVLLGDAELPSHIKVSVLCKIFG